MSVLCTLSNYTVGPRSVIWHRDLVNVCQTNAVLIEEPARRNYLIKRRLFVGIKASTRGLSLGEFLCMTHRDLVGCLHGLPQGLHLRECHPLR